MNLTHVANFVKIAEAGSLSKAASIIRIAQPALSRQVKALEDELGAALLVRHAWGVSLTPAGEALLGSARRILEDVQQARDTVHALEHEPIGVVTVGAPSSLATTLFPLLLSSVRERFPRVHLRLIDALSGNLHQRTLKGDIDLAILHDDRALGPLSARPLLSEDLGLIGAADQIAGMKTLTHEGLRKLPLIMQTAPNRSRRVLSATVGDLSGQLVAEVDCLPALMQIVAAGQGFCILPYSSIEAQVTRGELGFRDLPPPTPKRDMALASPLDRPPTVAVRVVERELRRLVEDLAERMRWRVSALAAPR